MYTLYYEDLTIGTVYRTAGRTVTEADCTAFCALSGDWNPIHCNEDYARQTRFGQRIAPGLLGVSLITGALHQWGIFDQSALAMLNLREWSFSKPIFLGSTLMIEMELVGKRLISSGKAGIVERHFRIIDSNGALVQSGYSDMMIARSPSSPH